MGAVAQQFGVADEGRIVYGNAGDYVEAGSVNLKNSQIKEETNYNSGFQISGGSEVGNINVQGVDPKELQDALKTFQDYAAAQTESTQGLASSLVGAIQKTVSATGEKLFSFSNKQLLWIGGGLVVFLGLIWFTTRKT